MKKVLHFIGGAISWAFTIFCILAMVYAVFSFAESKRTGKPVTVLGYRPVYVLTGSMEPTMQTDSIVITKTVSSMNDIHPGDVVTYHVENDEGRTLVVTHRIRKINEDGTMVTKGDNNRVEDAIPITIDNVEAKVVLTCNWVASIVHTWNNGVKGKFIICAFVAGIVIFLFTLGTLTGEDKEEKGKETESEKETKNEEKEEQKQEDEHDKDQDKGEDKEQKQEDNKEQEQDKNQEEKQAQEPEPEQDADEPKQELEPKKEEETPDPSEDVEKKEQDNQTDSEEKKDNN